jgi:hypothetical protein
MAITAYGDTEAKMSSNQMRSRQTNTYGILLLIAVSALLLPGAAQAQIDAFWANLDGGVWTDGANWSTDPSYPDDDGVHTYNAIINLVGDPYTVSLNSDITINDFTLDSVAATLSHTAGAFKVFGTADLLSGTYLLDGGTIMGGTWNVGPGNFVVTRSSSNRLDGVTFNGNLDLSTEFANLRIGNGLSLNGAVNLSGNYARLTFEGAQVFDDAEVNFGATSLSAESHLSVDAGGFLTLGPNLLVHGGFGRIDGGGVLLNRGRIAADIDRRALRISPAVFVNEGILEALEGGMAIGTEGTSWINSTSGEIRAVSSALTFDGNWSNQGTITSVDSRLRLGGRFTTAGIGTLDRSGGDVWITGTLNHWTRVPDRGCCMAERFGVERWNSGTVKRCCFPIPTDATTTWTT